MTAPTPLASPQPSDEMHRVVRHILWIQRVLMLGVVGLYLAAISPWWNTSSDSSLYLMLGQNLARGEGYTLYGEPNAFVPPGFPLVIAGLTRLGLGDMLWLNAAMTAMALATVLMIYCLLRSLLPQREPFGLRLVIEDSTGAPAGQLVSRAFCYDPAFACTLAAALLYDMFEVATRQYSDIPFMLLVFTGLWAYHRGLQGRPSLLWLGTIALAATAWFRVVGLPLAAGAVVGLLIEPRKISRRVVVLHAALLTAATAATIAAFHLWHQYAVQGAVPQETYAGEIDRFRVFSRSPLEWVFCPLLNFYQTGEALADLLTGQPNIPNIVAILLLACPILLGMRVRWMQRQYLPLAITVAYVGIILLMRPLKDRYLLPVAPLLLLYLAAGVRWLIALHTNRQTLAKAAVVVLLSLLAAIGVFKDAKYAARLHDGEFQRQYRQPLIEAAAALRQNHREGEWFTTKWGENLSYLSGVPYRNLYGRFGRYAQPSPEEMLRLLDEMNITLVVDRIGIDPLPYCETMIDAVKRSPRFRLIFENKYHRIYRRLPEQSPTDRQTPKPNSPPVTTQHESRSIIAASHTSMFGACFSRAASGDQYTPSTNVGTARQARSAK